MSDNYRKDPEAITRLTREQCQVTQQNGTELPFNNEYWDNKEPGIYVDAWRTSTPAPWPSCATGSRSGAGWH